MRNEIMIVMKAHSTSHKDVPFLGSVLFWISCAMKHNAERSVGALLLPFLDLRVMLYLYLSIYAFG
jgi:hypothetical protein